MGLDATRTFSRCTAASLVLFVAVMCMLAGARRAYAQDAAPPVLVGRLATVEPSARRITMVPEGEVERVEMFVTEDGDVQQESRTLTLADLVIRVGRRVTIRYRLDGARRLAERIIVEPD